MFSFSKRLGVCWLASAVLILFPGFASAQCVWNPDRHIHQCPSVPAYVPTIYDWGSGIGNGGENPGAQFGVGWGGGVGFLPEPYRVQAAELWRAPEPDRS